MAGTMKSIRDMVERELARDDTARQTLGDGLSYYFQPMIRNTGRVFGTPRLITEEEAQRMAERLPAVVWYNTSTGDVVYARWDGYPVARKVPGDSRTTSSDEVRVEVPREVARSRRGKILQRSRTAIIREARALNPVVERMGVQAIHFGAPGDAFTVVWFTNRFPAEDGLQ